MVIIVEVVASERQHLLGVGRKDSEWGRRTTKGVLPEEIDSGIFAPIVPPPRKIVVKGW